MYVACVPQARYNVPCITGRTAQQDTKEAACSQFCSRVNLLNKDLDSLKAGPITRAGPSAPGPARSPCPGITWELGTPYALTYIPAQRR